MNSKYESLLLRNQLCFPIYLCAKEVVRTYSPLLSKIDLTYTQYIVMMYFWEKKESNVKEISRTLLLDSSTLTPLLKKLENKGYITRVKSKIDERNLDIKVTNKGLSLRDKALSIPKQIGECLNLTELESETLYKLTYKILLNTQKEEK